MKRAAIRRRRRLQRRKALHRTGFKTRMAPTWPGFPVPEKVSSLAYRIKNPRSRYWLHKADELWAWIVVARAAGKSEKSGRIAKGRLNAHHLVPRTHYPTRHDLANGIALSPWEHIGSAGSPHGFHPELFEAWLQERRPNTWAYIVANDPRKRSNQGQRPDWRANYEDLVAAAETLGLKPPKRLLTKPPTQPTPGGATP